MTMDKKKKAGELSGDLLKPARKGEAAPVGAAARQPEQQPEQPSSEEPVVKLSVKLPETLYNRLKRFGISPRRTNQEIMVAALEEYLERHDKQ